MMVIILIDLNLPEPGQALYHERENRLEPLGDKWAKKERFKGLDLKARLALRRGDYRTALASFRRKRVEAPEYGENGRRELVWLLYTVALSGLPDDGQYAQECQQILAAEPELGPGNDDMLYLLRALAAWAWRRRDLAALARLKPYLPQLQARLESRQDTGPAGFTLAYLHLCAGDGLDALPPWETISVNLEAADRYFLELAIFGGLLARPGDEIRRWLDRYQQERRAVMTRLQADRPDGLTLEVSDTRLADQEALERRRLLGAEPPAWEALVASGLLPW